MVIASLTRENISVFVWRKIFSLTERTFSPKQMQNAPKKDAKKATFSVGKFFADRFVLFFLLSATSDYKIFPISSFPAMRNPDSSTL